MEIKIKLPPLLVKYSGKGKWHLARVPQDITKYNLMFDDPKYSHFAYCPNSFNKQNDSLGPAALTKPTDQAEMKDICGRCISCLPEYWKK
jgi:hypothetical protein